MARERLWTMAGDVAVAARKAARRARQQGLSGSGSSSVPSRSAAAHAPADAAPPADGDSSALSARQAARLRRQQGLGAAQAADRDQADTGTSAPSAMDRLREQRRQRQGLDAERTAEPAAEPAPAMDRLRR